MKRCMMGLLLFTLTAVPVRAHFIWIVPDAADGTKVRVIFSDNLEPDDAVPVERIAATELLVRNADGTVAALNWEKGEHAYLVRVPGKGPIVVGGVCRYGVVQRGESKPFLLAYYPKFIQGEVKAATPWDKLPLEIVPRGAGRFQVLFAGKPAAGAEVVVLTPAADGKETHQTDARGEFEVRSAAPGLYGLRARHIETKAGEHAGKKYEEVRHYATLVFRRAEERPRKVPADPAAEAPAYPPLPRAVSSFGAAVADGWLYVYGGHSGKAHQYSTDTVVGTFHRLRLADPKSWEELPGGPALQGLALVAHEGKLYRLGGMQPRNQPGTTADNHSLPSCARFDPATRQWENLPDLPEGRSSHDAVVIGDRIIVVGGWRLNGAGTKPDWHSTALILDLKKEPLRWEAVKQPFRRRALTAAAHDGKVYVMAGLTPDGELELTVDVYDPAKDSWAAGPDLPGPLSNGFSPAACAAGGRLFVSTADGRLWRLAEKGDAWEAVGTLKQPRFVHRMVPAGDELLLAVGGASRSGSVALTEAIVPSCCAEPRPTLKPARSGEQAFCPVMTDMPVNEDSPTVEYQGIKVRLCCSACLRKWKADPTAYLDPRRLPQLAGMQLPERAIPQVYCPVYRNRVVSANDPSVIYKGKKVYLFNQTAVRKWEENPEKYADPAILPQLRDTGSGSD